MTHSPIRDDLAGCASDRRLTPLTADYLCTIPPILGLKIATA
jgi:hypothetical protein